MSKLRELSWADRMVLVRAAVLLVCAKLALPFIEFRIDPGTAKWDRSAAPSESVRTRARIIARLVGIASAHCPIPVACLHCSLVTWRLLREQGIPCELRLGANATAARFEAHAWVECAGVALDDAAAQVSRFSPFGEAVVPICRQPWRLVTRWVA